MTSKDSSQDQELLDRYRRASDTDTAAPSEAVRSAILTESRRVAGQLAAKESPPPFDVSRPAANDSRWKITAFGTAGAALLAALLIAPRYWESPPTAPTSTSAAAPSAAPTAAPAAASESKSANSDAVGQPTATALSSTAIALAQSAAPAKLESIAPSRRSYAPAPLALRPAPAAPPPFAAQTEPAPANDLALSARAQGGALMSADRAARAARDSNAPAPENLQRAAAAGDLVRTTLLLDQGAAVDTRDALGRTPLLLAVAQDRLEVVRLLLARGADPNAADNTGLTPLQLAKDNDLQDIAAVLERAGAH